jgi:hypothetical protein
MAMWQALVAADRAAQSHHLAFRLVCSSESRAARVEGATRPEVQSLANLETLFTWLRRTANSHQVSVAKVWLA